MKSKHFIIGISLACFITASLFSGGAREDSGKQSITTGVIQSVNTFEDNVLVDLIEEKFDVSLDLVIMTDDNAVERRNLMFASNTYPEFFMDGGFSTFEEYEYGVNAGILIPLNDYISEELTPHIYELFESSPDLKKSITAPDGNIYTLPYVEICYHVTIPEKMWINETWLEKLNLPMPTTIEEFENVLIAFKTQDPNGNGITDEIPMSGVPGVTWQMEPFYDIARAFVPFMRESDWGAPVTLGVDPKNNVYAPYTDPRLKGALEYMAELYSEGLYDPNSFTQTVDQLKMITTQDVQRVGVFKIDSPQVFLTDVSDYTVMSPLEGPLGVRHISQVGKEGFIGGTFAITDKASDDVIRIAMQMADYFFTDEGCLNSERGVGNWEAVDSSVAGNNVYGEKALYRLKSYLEDASGVKSNKHFSAPRYSDMDKYSEADDFYQSLYDHTVMLEEFADASGYKSFPLRFYADSEQLRRLNVINGTIQPFFDQSAALFITGEKNLTSDWDAYVEEINQLGLEEYISIHQDILDNQ